MTNLSLKAQESFEEVLALYSPMIYRLAYSRSKNVHDANDITQDVLLKYLRADKTYNDENHRKAWLIKTTINTSKTLLLSSWNRRRTDEDAIPDKGGIDKNVEAVELRHVVFCEVMGLPKKYRTVVHLFYYEDMTVSEISAITGQRENTVKSQLLRARNLLKEKLEGVEFDEL